jgi:(p)ppGpp synthase/HD superfamily hydrolase
MLSHRFVLAFEYAFELHVLQMRKGTTVPYMTHLMSVAALVLENGGDEDQAIAGLLHDAVEDQGGLEILAVIQDRFGERVARIVEGCTDATTIPKPPWRARKEQYIAHLNHADMDIQLVSLADKLHNARTLLADLQTVGPTVWKRFNGGKEGTLWYYRALADLFNGRNPLALTREFNRIVTEIEQLGRIL